MYCAITPSALGKHVQYMAPQLTIRGANSPDSCDPNFQTLRILQQRLKELEERLNLLLEAFYNVLQDGEENEDSDLAVCDLWGKTCCSKEWKKLRPLAERNLDSGDGGDDTSGGVAYEFAGVASQ